MNIVRMERFQLILWMNLTEVAIEWTASLNWQQKNLTAYIISALNFKFGEENFNVVLLSILCNSVKSRIISKGFSLRKYQNWSKFGLLKALNFECWGAMSTNIFRWYVKAIGSGAFRNEQIANVHRFNAWYVQVRYSFD